MQSAVIQLDHIYVNVTKDTKEMAPIALVMIYTFPLRAFIYFPLWKKTIDHLELNVQNITISINLR